MFTTQRKVNILERSRLNSSNFFHLLTEKSTALPVAVHSLCDSQESAFDFGESRQPSATNKQKERARGEGRMEKTCGLAHFSLPSVFKLGKDAVVRGSCHSNLSLLLEWYQANYQHECADRLAKASHSSRTSQDQTIGFGAVFHHYFLLVSQQMAKKSNSHLVPSVQDASLINSKQLAHWEEVSWHSRQKCHSPKRSPPLSSTASYGICYDMREKHIYSH